MDSALPDDAFVTRGLSPQRRGQSCPIQGRTRRSPESWCGRPLGRVLPHPLPQKRNPHPFLGEDTRATSSRRPERPFAVGTKIPAPPPASTSLSVKGAPGIRRPRLPAREAVTLSFKRQFPGSRSDNQGAPGPDAAKTRRGPARESQARHPLAGTGPVTTQRRAEVRPAQPRCVPTRQKDPGRGARATKAAGTRGHGGQSLDRSARPGPGRSRRLSAPPPALASSPGRVGSSTLLFGSKGDTLRAQGAGCGHKSRRRALLPAARTGTPGRRPRVPTTPDAPLSRSGPGGPETAQGIQPEASPFTREGTALSTWCHHLPSPRSPDPEVAWASPHRCLG